MEGDPRLQLLAETRARIAEMEKLLEELPGLFEAKFRQRLQPLLEQQQQLHRDNAELRQQLLSLRSAAGENQGQRRLLAFPGRRLRAVNDQQLRQQRRLRSDDDAPPTAASAGPTRR
ncbi:MAG: hypothetical protein VKL97_03445 [Cyanobacteriota bacterium]|nr:hypothetical protein [Cyanobacteriota bacterium]